MLSTISTFIFDINSAKSAVLVEDILGGNPAPFEDTAEFGYRFRPTTDISVTGLSLIDVNQDGLAGSYNVNLWDDATQSLLANVNISSSNDFDESGLFRTASLDSPLSLEADKIYLLSASWGDANEFGEYIINANNVITNPLIEIIASSTTSVTTLNIGGGAGRFTFPDDQFPTGSSILAPSGTVSLQFESVSTPEPTIVLGILAFGGMGLLSSKKKVK